ncbi:MAG: UDP-N-acetylmuramoyl-L-alanine--D-glutamate ligase [Akkermansia sp.]
MNLSQRKIAVLGCGRSGLAAAHLAMSQGAKEVCIFDSNPKASCGNDRLMCKGGATEEDARAYAADLVILSPGIECDIPWTRAFCEPKSALLIGETEFAYRYFKGKIIAITGTNGKTTTTALVEHILKSAGRKAIACGNYGLPLSEVVLMKDAMDYAVLEVSSFQMESIVDFKPAVAIWLNFAPDHMDRYTKVEDYYNAKKEVFRNMGEEELVIIQKGQDVGELPCKRYDFSAFEEGGNLSYQGGCIMEAGHAIIDLNKTRLYQAHNAENSMAALLSCRAMGLSDEQIQAGISSFIPPSHRCEMVAEFDRILWLNDSKSTNLHSTEAALRSQTRPCILIVGGKDKGLEYTQMGDLLKSKVHLCICFGQIADQLMSSLSPFCTCQRAETVEECVRIAHAKAKSGDVVLFSPGTSSFDQFTGYAQRGQCFRDAVLDTVKP